MSWAVAPMTAEERERRETEDYFNWLRIRQRRRREAIVFVLLFLAIAVPAFAVILWWA